ncbi:MAG: HEAT repeat domain-containing protein [bacterium]
MSEPERLRVYLPLYDSDELSVQERAAVDEWLERDPSGREELQAIRELQRRVQNSTRYEPQTATLQRLRSDLVDRLEAEAQPRFALGRRLQRWFFEGHPVRQIGFALATLVLGVFMGRQFFTRTEIAIVPQAAPDVLALLLSQQPIANERSVLAPHLANVHAIRIDPATGQIEIEFSTVNNVSLRGSAEDPLVRQMLAYAMREEETTGLRLRAVKAACETVPAQIVAPEDNELTRALLQVLRHDTNDGVRLKAVETLNKLPAADDIKDGLIQALLRDPNPAVRVQVLEALSRYQSAEKVSALRAAAAGDTNGYVRLQAVRLLDQIREQQVR